MSSPERPIALLRRPNSLRLFLESSAVLLLTSAAQSEAPEDVLGRVMGLVSLVHRGSHATALLLVAPLYAVLPLRRVFVGAAITLLAVSCVVALAVGRAR